MSNRPQISAIISNFNGAKYLPRLLESLQGQRGVEVEVVVVDRNSTDESAAALAAHPEVKVVQEPPQSGLVSGYAAGVPHARYDNLFFCNEDMWFDPDCLRLLAERLDPAVGVVAADPWQWTYDGETLIHAGTRFRAVRYDPICAYPLRRQLFTEPVAAGDFVPFPCAGAFLMQRGAYETAGGWDRSFFLDHEDIDLFVRVWQLGGRCVSVPDARVYHAVGSSNAQQITTINTPVKRRRHVAGIANVAVIGLKYFSVSALAYPLAYPLLAAAKEAVRLRGQRTWLALLAAREVLRRSGEVLRFRSRWAAHNRRRPGQRYFTAEEFSAAVPPAQQALRQTAEIAL